MIPFLDGVSDFSAGQSLIPAKALPELASGAATLCDHMGLWGVPSFVKAAREKGVRPIIGARLAIHPTLDRVKAKHNRPAIIRAIVLDEAGWFKLMGLLSLSFDDDHFYESPRLLLSDVIAGLAGGGVALALGSAYGAFARGRGGEIAAAARDASIPVYSDVSLSDTPFDIRLMREALELWRSEGVPALLVPSMRYRQPKEADALDLMAAIVSNARMDAMSSVHPFRPSTPPDEARLRGLITAMRGRYQSRYGEDPAAFLAQALRETQAFPAQVTFEWSKLPPALPALAADPDAALAGMCKLGFKERLTRPVFGHTPADLRPYAERLRYELDVLRKLGFAPYFLLVSEIVNEARRRGILVGPGRGSVGGSLVAFLIGMTDVDPLRFNLMFERFINPERLDLPDADLDFMSTRREELVGWVRERFGEDRVAGVANYMTIAAAGALQNACRMLGVEDFPAFSALVPKENGVSASIDEAIEVAPELDAFAAKHPHVVEMARRIEGRVRGFGKHAAGLVISDEPMLRRAVVERRGGDNVICWDKRTAEDFGLVKIDMLGLSTLDLLDIASRKARQLTGHPIDFSAVSLDDPAVLAAFGRGETVGVFQVESISARRMLKDMAKGKPLTFDDIVAGNALNRPGPINAGLVDEYTKRRNGEKPVTYLHPAMKASLAETYGVLVYQEQLMQISKDLSGFTGSEADVLRKAVGKKDADLMRTMKEKFINGAVAGHVEVTLEDGRKVRVHRARKLKVKGSDERLPIEEIARRGLELGEIL